MLFNVQRDEGHKIVAYVVPDGGGYTPSLVLRAGGRDILRLEANDVLPDLVASGRHSTGLCGFNIDESMVPGLASYADLEVVEATRDVLVYRRRQGRVAEMQVFRFETHLLPLWRIDEALKHSFQFWYKGIDRYGRETANQVFNLQDGRSSYVSGRLQYRNYEFYLTKGIKTVAVLRDPYCELAERLILLKNIGSRAEEILGERDVMIFAPIVEALDEWEIFDDTFCKRFFRRAPPEISVVLSNPLVRQLTGATPDEMPNQGAVAAALDSLASFELLGLRSSGSGFVAGLAELVGVEPASIPAVDEYPRISELGDRLRQNRDVESLLEKDLEVFHSLSHAFDTADQPNKAVGA